MNLENYIIQLLQINDSVIIPGFGSFYTEHVPARITENEILPPSKKVLFNPHIKNNDGFIAGFISETENLPLSGAYKFIEDQVENIIYRLDKGEKVSIGELGTFKYDQQNKICFETADNENLSLGEFGFRQVSLDDIPEEIIEEPVELVTEINTEQIKSQEEIFESIDAENNNDFTENEQATEPDQTIISPHEMKEIYDDFQTPVKKKNRLWWWLFLLIPVAGSIYFFLQNQKEDKSASMVQKEAANIPLSDTLKADSISVDSIPVPDSVKIAEQNVVADTSKYYIVGGGFKVEENAAKYVGQLKAKGIPGIRLGQRGSLHLVGVAWFDTQADALKALNEYCRQDSTCGMWIYKMKSAQP